MTSSEILNGKFDLLLDEVGQLRTHLETTVSTVSKMEKTLLRINKKYGGIVKRLNATESDIQEINDPLGH